MERKKSFLLLTICTLLLVSISQVVNATTYTSSSETNIALNPSRSGYPNPLESDQGWGGGSDKWEIVDGLRDYPEWYHGLAFTGGTYYGVPGVRQATIAFGEDHTFDKVIIWHHTYVHIPADVNLQYWDGSAWKSINFQRDLNLTYQPDAGYADTLTFEPITGSKVRYSFDNSRLNILGTQIEHGWIYEFEVYEYVDTNQPPIANAGELYQANEGSPVIFDASLSNDPDEDTLQYRWDFESDGVWDTNWLNEPTATHTWNDDWNGDVTLEVSDGELNSTDTATVTISNANPVAEAGNDQTVNEGDTVSFSGSYTDAGTDDTQTIKWDFGDGTTSSDTLTPTHIYADNRVYTVTLNVTDDNGGVGTDTLTLAVNNVNPALGEIVYPTDPASVNTKITTSCSFTNAGLTDTHTGVWDWGDGTSSLGSVSEVNGAGTITGEHAYTGAGIYRVNLTVTDNDGGSASTIAENYIVVYNPEGGFVTGGGWINSPADAYTPDSTLTGKATFGFVSKYQKGTSVPTGNTEFQFKAADLDFKSTSYEWLVVANSQAIYKGTGTINGRGNYGLILTAVDGDNNDKFRIKIWDKDNDKIIYDNEIGTSEDAEPLTAIGGGSIVIHEEK